MSRQHGTSPSYACYLCFFADCLAIIEYTNGSYIITDQGTRMGIQINNFSMPTSHLAVGDEINLACTYLTVTRTNIYRAPGVVHVLTPQPPKRRAQVVMQRKGPEAHQVESIGRKDQVRLVCLFFACVYICYVPCLYLLYPRILLMRVGQSDTTMYTGHASESEISMSMFDSRKGSSSDAHNDWTLEAKRKKVLSLFALLVVVL